MDENFKNRILPKALEREILKAHQRPTWESRNEGVHERVNFDDTIWGFHLAGGAYYNTPLRVTQVKEDSRAEYAGIKIGDVLKSINSIDTSTLTVQEAHDMIQKSGIEIKLELLAPDIEETMYYVYEDELSDEFCQARRHPSLGPNVQDKKFKGAKTNKAWSIAWPCSKKRDVMYRESNCYMVPSKYEMKHPEKENPPKNIEVVV